MSSTKTCSVFVIVMVLCVTTLELTPRQTASRQQGAAVLFFVAFQGQLRDVLFDPIVFNQVLVNQGSAYNNDTGMFTAPVAGIHQFVFAAQLCRGDLNNVWAFVINGQQRMVCHAQMSGGDTSLNTCYFMTELRKGDQVWMRQNVGSCAWASTTSNTITFSGVLLAREGASTLGTTYGSGSSCLLPSLGLDRDVVSGSAARSATLSSVAVTLLLCCLLLD